MSMERMESPPMLELLVALSYLDPLDREILLDRRMCGLSLERIAARDGVSRQWADYRCRRGAEHLRLLLAGRTRQLAA
jgi:DNA-directed RNA polymerase specialized sigma24 family protein